MCVYRLTWVGKWCRKRGPKDEEEKADNEREQGNESGAGGASLESDQSVARDASVMSSYGKIDESSASPAINIPFLGRFMF